MSFLSGKSGISSRSRLNRGKYIGMRKKTQQQNQNKNQATDSIKQTEQQYLDKTISIIEKKIADNIKWKHLARRRNEVPGPDHYRKRINKYRHARELLYFARIDIENQGEVSKYYIGKYPVDEKHTKNIIYDWRSRIGDIFASYNPGEKVALDDETEANNNLLLKRNIDIENDKVIKINDVSVVVPTTGEGKQTISEHTSTTDGAFIDEYLSEILTETSSADGMQSIVETIQKDQNKIIRSDYKGINIIQGVAGSGKTAIAFHRISYLLYRYHDTISADQFLIIAPSKLYLSHVQNVFMPLQIENLTQHTMNSLAFSLMPDLEKKVTEINEPFVKLASVIDRLSTEADIKAAAQFKGSLQFKTIIDVFLDEMKEREFESIESFEIKSAFKETYVYTKEQILERLQDLHYLTIKERRASVFQSIERWKNETRESLLEEIDKELERIRDHWVAELPTNLDERKQLYNTIEKIAQQKRENVQSSINNAWNSYKKRWKTYDTLSIYNEILTRETLENAIDNHVIDLLVESKSSLDYVDVPALLYIEHEINGFDADFKHIVIDEAQDLSPFHFHVLKLLSTSMTVLGDVTQGIYTHTGIKQWEELIPSIFGQDELTKSVMNVSYRSTKDIIDVANRVIDNSKLPFEKAIPVQRVNNMVTIREITSEADLLNQIKQSIEKFRNKGYERIAIINKDTERSENLYQALVREGYSDNIQIILNSNTEIRKEINIIPSYLVKGLEFDAVIIPNGNKNNYDVNELDAKLLYISITRALHALDIFFYHTISPLLEGNEGIKKHEEQSSMGIL